MGVLSNELISQFVKATKDNSADKNEITVYGTVVEQDGSKYVQLDGSELLTPIGESTTANVSDGERVTVMIKNHTVVITGNLSSPSAKAKDVQDIGDALDKIEEFEIIVADKVSTEQLEVERGRIDTLVSENALIRNQLIASEGYISDLQADDVVIKDRLTASEAEITNIKTSKLDVDIANAKFATINELDATNADIHNLNATFGDFRLLSTNKFSAIVADIDDLQTTKLSASEAELTYANIDFSNIGKAAIEYFYATSGLIQDVVVGDGIVTGRLVGVTISGDLIEGNTVIAEKLVIKGDDGLYYKLNTDGIKTAAEQTDYNSLNGSIIKAKSVTAEKISVTDLVAFGATIGGFKISDKALYSGVKASVDNTTEGVYLDSDGQLAVGDANNFIKYYVDGEGVRRLAISASSIILSSKNRNVEDELDDIHTTTEDLRAGISDSESLIRQLSDSISMLVTDGNGTSLMVQDENGWTFSTAEIQATINSAMENLGTLLDSVGDVGNAVDILKQTVDDLGAIAEYVKIGTYSREDKFSPKVEALAVNSGKIALDPAFRGCIFSVERNAIYKITATGNFNRFAISGIVGSSYAAGTEATRIVTQYNGSAKEMTQEYSFTNTDYNFIVVNLAVLNSDTYTTDLNEADFRVSVTVEQKAEDEPCIELGEADSEFKLRITNTRMIFTEGSTVLAYFNNQSLHIKKAVVEEELQQGGFVWKARSNGNLGLVWKGGTS